jgi:V/A-type H+-transporting ATPase subunit I
MAIARLKKVVILGESTSKKAILEALQESALLHLIPLNDVKDQISTLSYENLKDALHYLKTSPQKRRLQTPRNLDNIENRIDEILLNKRNRAQVVDKIELIKNRIKDVTPWGDFEFPQLDSLNGYRFWFYTVPLSKKVLLEELSLPWKILGLDHKQLYIVAVSQSEPSDNEMPFTRVHVGSRSLSQLNIDLDEAFVELEDLNAERESLTRWIKPLTHSLDETINLARLAKASGLTFDADQCFALTAWISVHSTGELEKIRKQVPFAYTLKDPDKTDNPPTLLHNSDLVGGGETAVSFFQLPGYRSWDPSTILFFSFSLFFAIILADAGYAIILGGLLAVKWKDMSRSRSGRRLRNLFTSIIITSTLYGIVIGSYFGIVLPEGSFLAKLQILNLNDFSTMMKLSIGIGVLHLLIANCFALWKHRQSYIALSNLGWLLVISSSYLLWLSFLKNDQVLSLDNFLCQLFIFGLTLVICFSTKRKIKSWSDLSLKTFDGVISFYKITKAFGDVLSYMRLFALGLSSASLAVTFNQLAVSASESVPAGGFILFTLIILFGHVLNFILAIMSGVIHGLRLNLLEFYNWSIEGEGYPFEAFKRNQDK